MFQKKKRNQKHKYYRWKVIQINYKYWNKLKNYGYVLFWNILRLMKLNSIYFKKEHNNQWSLKKNITRSCFSKLHIRYDLQWHLWQSGIVCYGRSRIFEYCFQYSFPSLIYIYIFRANDNFETGNSMQLHGQSQWS